MQVAVALSKLRAPSTPLPHTKSHHPLFSLPTNKSRRYTNQVFFSPVTPSRITTNDILKSPQVKFLIVWSYFKYFTVDQPPVRNSMHFQSTYILHLQNHQSETHLESSQAYESGAFFAKVVNLLRPLAAFAEVLYRGCLTEFYMPLCQIIYSSCVTFGLHQRSLPTSFNNTRSTRTNSSTRWKVQTRVTNSQAATHESWPVRCSPCAPGFSWSNQQDSSTPIWTQFPRY